MLSALTHDFILHLVIPRPSNNYKAKLLHFSYLSVLVIVMIGVQLVINYSNNIKGGILGYASNIPPDEVVRLTNIKRAEGGLSELKLDQTLTNAALAKGTHMIEKDYWAHVAPDGTEPWYFFANAGYNYKYAGENLARDFSNPTDAVNAWMASPSHRENLMSDKYTEIGIAVVEGEMNGVETTIIVQLFGTRINQATNSIPSVAARQEESIVTKEEATEPEEEVVPVSTNELSYDKAELPKYVQNPFDLTKWISISVIGVLFIVMSLDAIMIARRRVVRRGGRIAAHLSFLGMVIVILLIVQAGKIL